MRTINVGLTAVAVMVSLAVMSFITLPMPEPLSVIHPAPDVLAASVMADINAANPYDHWSTLRDHQGRRPNVLRTIMGMGGITLQGPGASSSNPRYATVSVAASTGAYCYINTLACAPIGGQVATYYDASSVWNLYVGGANAITISNSTRNITLVPGNGGITISGTAGGVFNPNVDGNWLYWSTNFRVNGNFYVDGTIGTGVASGSFAYSMLTGARMGNGGSGYFSFDGSNNMNIAAPGIYATNTNATFNNNMGSSGTYSAAQGIANITTADVTSSGASNLISYTLPANALTATNRCLRITGWGTALNNANAKTVALDFGAQTIITKAIAPSIATESWKVTAVVCRSGASTQDIFAEAWNEGGTTVSSTDGATVLYQSLRTAGTQTETATIVIKGKTTVATTTDVTMDGLIVEYQ